MIVGQCTGKQPPWSNAAKRYKYDAWKSVASKSKEEAMEEFITHFKAVKQRNMFFPELTTFDPKQDLSVTNWVEPKLKFPGIGDVLHPFRIIKSG